MDILPLLNHKGLMLIQGKEQLSYERFCEKIIERSTKLKEQKLPIVLAIKAEYTINYWFDFFALLYNKHVLFPYLEEAPSYAWLEGIYTNGNIIYNQTERNEDLDLFLTTSQAGIVLETSGTSGNKKVVLHNFDRIVEKYAKLQRKFTTILVFSPEHISGIETMLSIIIPGGTVIIPADQNINVVCNIIEEKKVGLLACTPSFMRLAMVSGNIEKLKNIQILNLGGERTDENLLYKLKQNLPSTQVYQVFGTTETANIRTHSLQGSVFFKPGKEGEDYIINEGVLWLKKTPSIECFLQGKIQIENGWVCTNDRVEQNSDGYINILGRTENTINIGGEKVDPAEIENIIIKIKGILSVKVYGENDILMGKKLVADICIDQGESIKKSEIIYFCRNKLSDHKIPVKFHIHNEIALTSRLKIRKT